MIKEIQRCCTNCVYFNCWNSPVGRCQLLWTSSGERIEWKNDCDDFEMKLITIDSCPICEADEVKSRFELLDL